VASPPSRNQFGGTLRQLPSAKAVARHAVPGSPSSRWRQVAPVGTRKVPRSRTRQCGGVAENRRWRNAPEDPLALTDRLHSQGARSRHAAIGDLGEVARRALFGVSAAGAVGGVRPAGGGAQISPRRSSGSSRDDRSACLAIETRERGIGLPCAHLGIRRSFESGTGPARKTASVRAKSAVRWTTGRLGQRIRSS
jgi:hypothetical protein